MQASKNSPAAKKPSEHIRIAPMTAAHRKACTAIVAASEPWKTLNEGVDFRPAITAKQAFVALSGARVAGFILFTPEPVFARGGYLRAIAVAPDMRGHGIGERLLHFAEQRTARTAPNFYLCVSSFNRPAQAFYKKQGYAKIGKLDNLLKEGVSEYIYWKRLR